MEHGADEGGVEGETQGETILFLFSYFTLAIKFGGSSKDFPLKK